jgi:hypothetical protein
LQGGKKKMEGQEKFLGGVHDSLMQRGIGRGGYAIIATTQRIVGIKPFFDIYYSPRDIPNDELIQKSVKDKDFEIKKEEISKLLLKKPRRTHAGYLKILSKSGKEIQIKIVTRRPVGGLNLALAAFQKLSDLIQAFYPEAVELEE